MKTHAKPIMPAIAESDARPENWVPIYRPHFSGKEREYVLDCLDTGWISSRGSYIEKFERACADYIGTPHVSSVGNGTLALHLALYALGLKPGDEVIVPTLTYVASVNAIAYVGATPVFCEADAATWQLDPADVAKRITPRTKAIMVVHLYGQCAPMDKIMALAKAHGLYVIEDAAEALGSRIGRQHAGTFGDVGTFSFFGNKTLTTGEGGLVVARDPALHREMSLLKTHYASPTRRYWYDKIGFNFRMTNIQAAIGLGQFVDLDLVIARKRAIAARYAAGFAQLPVTCHSEVPGTTHNFWMCSLLVPNADQRDPLMAYMEENGIESRPLFYPVHTMPAFASPAFASPAYGADAFPVSTDVGARGINLPSFPDLTAQEQDRVIAVVSRFLTR